MLYLVQQIAPQRKINRYLGRKKEIKAHEEKHLR